MPGEDVYSWSTTASANGSADTLINWAEGQPRASVNNSARSMMAALAKQFALFNGSIVTTGTANAQSFTSGIGYTVVPNQFYARIKIGAGLTNTGAMTLQMDGLGAKTVLTAAATALTGGEFSSGGYTEVLYNGSNWVFLSSAGFVAAGGGGGGGGGGAPSSVTLITAPGTFTYTPAVTMTAIMVECVGGGGGGGGTSDLISTGEGLYYSGGSGGGSGGYSRKLLMTADVGVSKAVTVGAGGSSSPNANGQPGGVTQFGPSAGLVKAFGGAGGGFTGWGGGAGGAIGIGDLACNGAPGEAGWSSDLLRDPVSSGLYTTAFSHSGAGGSAYFGGGGVLPYFVSSFNAPATGVAGYYGGGGSGGWNGRTSSPSPAVAGGFGGNGLIVITEWGGHGTVT